MANYMSRHTGAQIDQAVAAVLAGNAGGSSVSIDKTLTQEGAAADAKATGERLSQLSEEMGHKQPTGNYVKTVNGTAPDENGNVVVSGGGSGGSSVAIDATLTQEGQAADAKAVGEKVKELSDDIGGIKAQIGEADYIKLGQTPQTLTAAGKVSLVASETAEFSVISPTVADFAQGDAQGDVTYIKCEKTDETKYHEIKLTTAINGYYEAYAKWTVKGLIPGEPYRLHLECTDNQDQPSNITIFPGGTTSTTLGNYGPTLGNWLSVETAIADFTPTTEEVAVYIYVVQTGRDGTDKTTWLEKSVNRFKGIYINRANYGSAHTEIVNKTGEVTDSVVLGDLPAHVRISATPACDVYFAEPEEEIYIPKSRHDGKVCVCFGDSITGNMAAPNDYPSVLAAETGMTVINGGFGGCRMGYHPNVEYDAFSMYRLADAVATGDWTLQQTHVASIASVNKDAHLEALMAVNWSEVDFITIAYGTNDTNGNAIDIAESPMSTRTVLGALRYSIERILTAHPHIKLLILTPIYRYWNDEDIDSDEKLIDGKHFVDYGDGMIEVAKAYKIPAVDMYRTLGFNAITRSYYFPATDGTHPNANGQKVIGGKIAARLLAEY